MCANVLGTSLLKLWDSLLCSKKNCYAAIIYIYIYIYDLWRDGQKAAPSPSLRKVTSKSPRITYLLCLQQLRLIMLCFSTIKPEIEKILQKNQNSFQRNQSTKSKILTIHRIIGVFRAKNPNWTLMFVDFLKTFDSIHRGSWVSAKKRPGTDDMPQKL